MSMMKKTFLAGAAALLLTTTIAGGMNSVRAQDAAYGDDAFGEAVRAYLLENPEVIVEAMENYQTNQQEIEARKFEQTLSEKKDILHSSSSPFAGNPDGEIVIVEFFDYNCGYCKRAIGDVQTIIDKEKDVKIIFKEMPILSESSMDAARYALAAHKQDKYFEYHAALMNFKGTKSVEMLEKIGADLGLDVEQMKKDAASEEIQTEIQESLALSRELGIRGTPAFIVDDVLSPGYLPYAQMKGIIAEVRNNKG